MKIASFVPAAEVDATSTEFVPGCRLSVAENAPDESAATVVIDVSGAVPPGLVPVSATSTRAPGVVVPDTGTDAASTVTLGRVRFSGTFPPLTVTGAVTLSGAAVGPPPA